MRSLVVSLVCVLSLSLGLSACSSTPEEKEQRPGKIEIIPDAVAPRSAAPAKPQPQAVSNPLYTKEALAKMSPETKRLIERENEIRRKRLANEPLGPSAQPKPYKF